MQNKLLRWHDAGYPPIDLNENVSSLVELIGQHKKMAIALQKIIELPQTRGHAYEMQDLAKEALKEAGI